MDCSSAVKSSSEHQTAIRAIVSSSGQITHRNVKPWKETGDSDTTVKGPGQHVTVSQWCVVADGDESCCEGSTYPGAAVVSLTFNNT